MKYDDEELAQAALLLAMSVHEEPSPPLSRALEGKLLARGKAITAATRFTTTKAAAISLEREPENVPPRRSNVAAWAGWLAAAACFAFAVYEWRLHSLERPRHAGAALEAGVLLVDPAGVAVGDVRLEGGDGGQLTVTALPRTAAGEHYRVWVSETDARAARAIGSFACSTDVECKGRTIRIAASEMGAARRLWIAKAKVGDPPAALDPATIIASAGPPREDGTGR